MNCGDFEDAWNERLDARGAAPEGLLRALESHAATCPACRALGARYQALELAVRSLGPSPAPPAGFADRVLAAAEAPEVVPFRPRLLRLAAAAAVLLAVGIGGRVWTARRVGPEVASRPVAPTTAPAPPADEGDLTEALAAATSATLDLAREASAPAARVGREVLVDADLPEAPAELDLPEAVGPVSDVIRTVGDRVTAGVRPLEGSARHAFSFLLGPTPEPQRTPTPAPKRGA